MPAKHHQRKSHMGEPNRAGKKLRSAAWGSHTSLQWRATQKPQHARFGRSDR